MATQPRAPKSIAPPARRRRRRPATAAAANATVRRRDAIAVAERLADAMFLAGEDVAFATRWEELLDVFRRRPATGAFTEDKFLELHTAFTEKVPPQLADAWRELSDQYLMQEIATKDAALMLGAAIGARFNVVLQADASRRFLRLVDGLFGRYGL